MALPSLKITSKRAATMLFGPLPSSAFEPVKKKEIEKKKLPAFISYPGIFAKRLKEEVELGIEGERQKNKYLNIVKEEDPKRYAELKFAGQIVAGLPKRVAEKEWAKVDATETEKWAFEGVEFGVAITGMQFVNAQQAATIIAKAGKVKLVRQDLIDITTGKITKGVKYDMYRTMVGDPAMRKEISAIAKNKAIPKNTKIADYVRSLLKSTKAPVKPLQIPTTGKELLPITPKIIPKLAPLAKGISKELQPLATVAGKEELIPKRPPMFETVDDFFIELNRPKYGKQGMPLGKEQLSEVNDLFSGIANKENLEWRGIIYDPFHGADNRTYFDLIIGKIEKNFVVAEFDNAGNFTGRIRSHATPLHDAGMFETFAIDKINIDKLPDKIPGDIIKSYIQDRLPLKRKSRKTLEELTQATKEVKVEKIPWRESFDKIDDPFRKASILRGVADISKSKSELQDVLNRVSGLPEEANIRWAVEQNPIWKKPITKEVKAVGQQEIPGLPEVKAGVPVGKPKTLKLKPADLLRLTGKEPATPQQIKIAHTVATDKALVNEAGKVKPQYRALAEGITGVKSITSMTKGQASSFINALKKLPEPYYKNGKLIPPSIPKTTKLVTQDFFKMKFKEPTIMKLLTPQTYYSQILGVKPLVEPLELAKQSFDLTYRNMANGVDKMIKAINKVGKTTVGEATKAKIKNIPTKAVVEMRDLLNKFEVAPKSLSLGKTELFNWFRNLNRDILFAENKIRESLELPTIRYKKAYVRHIADTMALEMLQGKYPFPQGLSYWSKKIVGKKIFNPMEFQRSLANDLEELWTKDLAHATKSMLWTGLKEINLSQPLKVLNEQMGTIIKDPRVFKNLTPEELDIYRQQTTMPASTRKWLTDYVNQVIKGQETSVDAAINRIVTSTGLKGIFNKILKPFGRTIGRKPITTIFQVAGRATIHGVMGPLRPKQLIRNKFQLTQNLALYTIKANIKGFYPATVDDTLKEFIDKSLFLKTYTGFEELPVNLQGKLEKLNLGLYQWTARSNVRQSMKVAYWDTKELITDPKYKKFGWADPERIALDYKVPNGKLFPSEKEKLLKEMEFGAGITQYHYIAMGMPEVFRHKSLIPLTRLQSWWMNYYFKFNREAIMRALKGQSGYGAKFPWSRRIGYLRYLVLGGLILNTLGYERSYLFGAAPTYLPPTAQLMMGMYDYVTTDSDWEKIQSKKQIFDALKTFIPGYLAYKDFEAIWSGRKNLKSLFFYSKWKKKPKGLLEMPSAGMPSLKIDTESLEMLKLK